MVVTVVGRGLWQECASIGLDSLRSDQAHLEPCREASGSGGLTESWEVVTRDGVVCVRKGRRTDSRIGEGSDYVGLLTGL